MIDGLRVREGPVECLEFISRYATYNVDKPLIISPYSANKILLTPKLCWISNQKYIFLEPPSNTTRESIIKSTVYRLQPMKIHINMETNIVGSFFRNKAPLHITSRLNDAVWRNFCKQSYHVNVKIQYFLNVQ